MKDDGRDMKILKIEAGNGFFRSVDGEYVEVDKINKERLLALVNATLEGEVEFDVYDESALHHQAQRIVYKNIVGKLHDLIGRKQEYRDESEKLFQNEFDKYRQATA